MILKYGDFNYSETFEKLKLKKVKGIDFTISNKNIIQGIFHNFSISSCVESGQN